MNILLINHYAGSKYHGMEYRPYYLSREWVSMGHQVTIVAASESHLRGKNPQVEEEYVEEWLDGIRYIWLKTPTYEGNGVKRAFNMFSFIQKLYKYEKQIIEASHPQVVIASSTYPLDTYFAKAIAKKTGAKVIFEVHDLWPLSPMVLGGMPPWHPFIFIMQRGENYSMRNVDRVVSILPKANLHLVKHGMAPEKFTHIPNGVDVAEWEGTEPLPDEHARVIAGYKAQGYFLVGYAGSIGPANAMDTLIESAPGMQKEKVRFILVGKGPEKERLQQRAKELGLDNVIFLPPIAKATIPNFLRSMDALYIGAKKDPLYQYGVNPNKLIDYLMAGRPIIHGIEAGNDMVRDSGSGISIPAEDGDAIIRATKELMNMPKEELARMGARGRKYALENHDFKVLAKRFVDVMEELIAEGESYGKVLEKVL